MNDYLGCDARKGHIAELMWKDYFGACDCNNLINLLR